MWVASLSPHHQSKSATAVADTCFCSAAGARSFKPRVCTATASPPSHWGFAPLLLRRSFLMFAVALDWAPFHPSELAIAILVGALCHLRRDRLSPCPKSPASLHLGIPLIWIAAATASTTRTPTALAIQTAYTICGRVRAGMGATVATITLLLLHRVLVSSEESFQRELGSLIAKMVIHCSRLVNVFGIQGIDFYNFASYRYRVKLGISERRKKGEGEHTSGLGDTTKGKKDKVIRPSMVRKHYKIMRREVVEVSYNEFEYAHLDFTFSHMEELLAYVMSCLLLVVPPQKHMSSIKLLRSSNKTSPMPSRDRDLES